MKRLMALLVVGASGWIVYSEYRPYDGNVEWRANDSGEVDSYSESEFQCDGRTHCSQMTS